MNRTRRAMLKKAQKLLEDAYAFIDIAAEEEEKAMLNTPKNVSGTHLELLQEQTAELLEAREFLGQAMLNIYKAMEQHKRGG